MIPKQVDSALKSSLKKWPKNKMPTYLLCFEWPCKRKHGFLFSGGSENQLQSSGNLIDWYLENALCNLKLLHNFKFGHSSKRKVDTIAADCL